jgi:23S rRNA A2030 N6-methylase RlmJ
MLFDLIVQMQNELQNHGNGYVQRFEGVLGQVATMNDPDCIGQVLPLFDDDAEYDEMMFSIIHTIERFDDATYVREIVDHLDSFFDQSP